jgi:hypothetical protein
MANKRKKLNVKKHQPAPAKPAKQKPKYKERVDIALIKDVKSIQAKYEKPIKSPVRELGKIKSELSDLRKPLYKLRAQFKKETRKTYADKLRKQIKAYEKIMTPKVEHLVEKRDDTKHLQKQFQAIRDEKRKKNSKIAQIDRKIDKAEENGDWKEVQRLSEQKLKELGNIKSLNETLGMPVYRPDVEGYETSEEADERGFVEDAANPMTIWEAANKVKYDVDSEQWDYIIINGKRFSTKNKIQIASEASGFWFILDKKQSATPRVLRFYNMQTRTVKYIPYKE